MFLRDYLAGQALIGVMFARFNLQATLAAGPDDVNQESIAEECYELADALLAERTLASADDDPAAANSQLPTPKGKNDA